MADSFDTKLVVQELLRYIRKDWPAQHKADTLEIWRINSKIKGDYQAAYRQAVAILDKDSLQ